MATPVTGAMLVLIGAVLLVSAGSRARIVPTASPWRAWRLPTARRARRADIGAVLAGMRDELLAGAALRTAFERAVDAQETAGLFAGALATSRMGGDVPAALRRDAADEPLLLSLAALWQVCEGSGAAVAAALDRLVDGARRSARIRQEIAAQLAGPRATMRVLAILPLIGIGMGLLMGADPLGFLFGSVWGWACLVVAGILESAGILWTRHLVASIESHL